MRQSFQNMRFSIFPFCCVYDLFGISDIGALGLFHDTDLLVFVNDIECPGHESLLFWSMIQSLGLADRTDGRTGGRMDGRLGGRGKGKARQGRARQGRARAGARQGQGSGQGSGQGQRQGQRHGRAMQSRARQGNVVGERLLIVISCYGK